LGPSEKISFVENYKECAILRENTPFCLAYKEDKNAVRVVRCTKNAAPGPKKKANPPRLSEKSCLFLEDLARLSLSHTFCEARTRL